ncbi:MAG: hypothetical protein ACC656_12680 [Candidatus Heimdallarchaeota archaeon]
MNFGQILDIFRNNFTMDESRIDTQFQSWRRIKQEDKTEYQEDNLLLVANSFLKGYQVKLK